MPDSPPNPLDLTANDLRELVRYARAAVFRAQQDAARQENPTTRAVFDAEAARARGLVARLIAELERRGETVDFPHDG